MKFSVQKDRVFVGITMGLIPIGVLLCVTGVIANGFTSFVTMLFGIVGLLGGSILTWSLFHSYIEITDEYVINQFGPFQTRITLDRIRDVRFIKDSSLAFSWSFVRMQLWLYPQEEVTIAMPEEEEEFLEALVQKLPSVNIADSKTML